MPIRMITAQKLENLYFLNTFSIMKIQCDQRRLLTVLDSHNLIFRSVSENWLLPLPFECGLFGAVPFTLQLIIPFLPWHTSNSKLHRERGITIVSVTTWCPDDSFLRHWLFVFRYFIKIYIIIVIVSIIITVTRVCCSWCLARLWRYRRRRGTTPDRKTDRPLFSF